MSLHWDNANRRISVSHKSPQGFWTWVPCDGKQTGSQRDMVRMNLGFPPSSQLCWLWNRKGDLQRAWNRDSKAVWDQVGLSHCWYKGPVTVRDKAWLRQGHNDQSRRSHQYSETTLTGESRFHISPPRSFEPGSLVMGSKQIVHWTSETWWEWSEIACSPQVQHDWSDMGKNCIILLMQFIPIFDKNQFTFDYCSFRLFVKRWNIFLGISLVVCTYMYVHIF